LGLIGGAIRIRGLVKPCWCKTRSIVRKPGQRCDLQGFEFGLNGQRSDTLVHYRTLSQADNAIRFQHIECHWNESLFIQKMLKQSQAQLKQT
jgi:hypothetical protein